MLLFITIGGCKTKEEPPVKTVTIEAPRTTEEKSALAATSYAKAEFTIEGMSCAMGCAAVIEKKLAAMEGVKSAKVNFEEKHATIAYDADKLSENDLANTVTRIGDGQTYSVVKMNSPSKTHPEK